MLDWCMVHPWMTFFIILAIIESITLIVKYSSGYHDDEDEEE